MKNFILSVAAVFAFGFTNAQETKNVKLGIKAGANYNWLATGDLSVHDLRPEVGYHAGLLAEFKICDKFSIQPEVLYSFSSYSFDGNGNGNGNSKKLEINEVAIPVVAKFYLVKGLSLEVGPQANIIVDSKTKGGEGNDLNLRKYNVSAVSGLAYDLKMGAFIQARYTYSFLNLENGYNGNNRFGIQASVGYKF